MSFKSLKGQSSLHDVCKSGKIKKVREFMKEKYIGNSINFGAGVFSYTPLHEATISRKPEIIELLLQKGANVDSTSNGGFTPLHLAASLGDLKCIEMLLKYNASVNVADLSEYTPHQTAENNAHIKAAKLLKTAGKST